MRVPDATVNATVSAQTTPAGTARVTVSANATALFVVLTTQAQGRFSDNSFLLEAGRQNAREIEFIPWNDEGLDAKAMALLRSSLRVEHLSENLD
jgi:hypothetical protein